MQAIETIYGSLKGLKPNQLKQLQRLYQQRLPGDCFSTPEFAQRLGAISTDLKEEICTYINRRGQVVRVGVGSPHQTQIPPLEIPRYGQGRLSGIRCLATSFDGSPPKESSLTAMALQRLDGLVLLNLTGGGFERRGGGATGYVGDVYLAHLSPFSSTDEGNESRWTVSEPLSLDALTQLDLLEWVEGLEAEFRREYVAREVDGSKDRVILVGLQTSETNDRAFQDGLVELGRLVDTAGGEVLETVTQKRSRPDSQTVVGGGKAQEIALVVQTLGANLVVFDRDLSPAQGRNLEKQLGVRVVDRTQVILDIFAQRARSQEGKLQVELAQLEYALPRLIGSSAALSRLGGGIGTRGPGETKLETERRAISKRLTKLQQEVNALQAHRSRLRQQRQDQQIPTIAIVGYTNAGKSTLLNTLTNADVYTADQLFATLDPTTRRLTVQAPGGVPLTILLTDTVGFIQELPPSLVDAFRATLEEVTEADALLHVVDLSHPAWEDQIDSVMNILAEMPTTPGPVLLAFNKIDSVEPETLEQAKSKFNQAIFISANQRLGLDLLREHLAKLILYTGT